ncbi:MAG TPA: glycosyl hydrolase family 18 protein [Candidatus Saccharimonadales bacterium]|nr:glycosyl hydrolase family 18 protein [Candidatus Saccharimonadales bacterium]
MGGKILFSIFGLILGAVIGYILVFYTPFLSSHDTSFQYHYQKNVIGFLPYWLLSSESTTYDNAITMLTYFGLRVDSDGSILKMQNPQQEEPGWYSLTSGKVNPFFQNAKKNNISLSLLVASGNADTITKLIQDPTAHAEKLAQSLSPISKKYGFSDINIDIEYTADATPKMREAFTIFLKTLRAKLPTNQTLTVDVSTTDVIKKTLIDVGQVGKIADNIVVMAYDFHAPDSFVNGPVAPLGGAGTSSEYDVATAMEKTVAMVPSNKVIMGVPLYGYEWEILGTLPRSAVIPQTGVLASNKRAEEFLASCSTCSAVLDTDAQEKYISYFSDDTNTNHILFYPDKNSMQKKVQLANSLGLGGIALWALGYEGNPLLSPLNSYRNQ